MVMNIILSKTKRARGADGPAVPVPHTDGAPLMHPKISAY